ncbi:MAG: hypothetical protein ACI910_000328 [Oleispira sp.]|jgi:hypothetical protein
MNKHLLIISALLSTNLVQAANFEISGYAGFEWREHFEAGQFNNANNTQADRQLGLTAEPEMVWSLAEGEHTIVFKPYARLDSKDEERSHADIRELSWMTYGDDWELTAGLSKVYWGVAESQHLVDIINQTDFVEAPDGEDKLGQPMIKFTALRDWGTVTGFVLPGFRERTFPGEEGRFRTALLIDTDKADYQAGEEDAHVDYAVRWNHTIDAYDVGISWFNGTSRDPIITPNRTFDKLLPFYAQINQLGLDFQATLDSWLWKFEAIYRSYDDSVKNSFADFGVEDYAATTGGFEYTFYGPFETVWDWGVLAEYQYDSRENSSIALGQNDAFLGSRLAFNDAASSAILAGISQDLDNAGTQSFVMEFATRINQGLTLNVDVFLLMSDDIDNVSYQFKRDDYVQLSLNYYY